MRRVLLFLVVVAATLAVAGTSSTVASPCSKGEVQVGYFTFAPGGPDGLLLFHNAEGRHFFAFDVNGAMVMEGMVPAADYGTWCPNAGPDSSGTLLHVVVDPDLSFDVDGYQDPEDWHWD